MIVVRVAGLPSGSARVGELPGTTRLLSDLDTLRGDLERRGEELADLIHTAVGGCEDRSVRRALLACRRAVHNGRPPGALPRDALARLPEPARKLLVQLGSDHEALARVRERARACFHAERGQAEHRLAEVPADDQRPSIGVHRARGVEVDPAAGLDLRIAGGEGGERTVAHGRSARRRHASGRAGESTAVGITHEPSREAHEAGEAETEAQCADQCGRLRGELAKVRAVGLPRRAVNLLMYTRQPGAERRQIV